MSRQSFEDKMNCQFQRSQYSLQMFIFQLVEACHQYNKHKTDIIKICNALFVIFHTGARGMDLPPPFFLTFCLQIYFQQNFFISLLFHLFFPYFNLFVSIFIQSYVNIKLHVSTLYRY